MFCIISLPFFAGLILISSAYKYTQVSLSQNIPWILAFPFFLKYRHTLLLSFMVKLFWNAICTHCLYFIDLLFTFQLVSICISRLAPIWIAASSGLSSIFILFNPSDTVENSLSGNPYHILLFEAVLLPLIPLAQSYFLFWILSFSRAFPHSLLWLHLKQYIANSIKSVLCF